MVTYGKRPKDWEKGWKNRARDLDASNTSDASNTHASNTADVSNTSDASNTSDYHDESGKKARGEATA